MKKRLLKICAASLAATLMMPALLFKDVSAATMGDVQDYIEAYTDYSELQGAYRVDDYILQAYVGYDESSAVFNLGAIIVEDEDSERFQFQIDAASGAVLNVWCLVKLYGSNMSYTSYDFSKSYSLDDSLEFELLNDGEVNFNPTSSYVMKVCNKEVNLSMRAIEYLLNANGFSLGDFGFVNFSLPTRPDDDNNNGQGTSGSGGLGGGGSVVTDTPVVGTDKKIEINKTNFPDDNFRTYLSVFDLDDDGYFDTNEIYKVDKFDISDKANGVIKSIKGVEFFANLSTVYLNNSSIENVDLSKNPKMMRFVSLNSALKSVNIENSALSDQTLTKEDSDDYFIAHDDNPSDYEELIADDVSVSFVDYVFAVDKNVSVKGVKVYIENDNGTGGLIVDVTNTEAEPTVTTVPTLTTKPTATPIPTEAVEKTEGVEDFAERLYTTCLGRAAEKAGKDFWASELKNGRSGAEVADGFFFSPEFKDLKLSNKEYITRLYRTFMGREPDQDGIDYWSKEMKSGKDRKFVFDGFVNSPEWADICLKYGIRSGGLATPTFEKKASNEVKAFAERLYTTCLGRTADPEGLDYWAQELANLRQTGTVAAQGFFFSNEFVEMHIDNKQYITRLYKTFMGREPDTNGYSYWLSELNGGKQRIDVFYGFANAPEFANLCADAGIMR